MEEDWLTQLLDAQGAPAMLPGGHHQPGRGVAQPRHKANKPITYITPPNMRKMEAVAAAATPPPSRVVAPIMAVRVLHEGEDAAEGYDETFGETVQMACPMPMHGLEPVMPLPIAAPMPVAPPMPVMCPAPAPAMMTWDASVSCVPPGAAWVTQMAPPRREKRSRKVRTPPRELVRMQTKYPSRARRARALLVCLGRALGLCV